MASPARAPDDDERIGRALVRLESAVAGRPGFGRATHSATTSLVDGLHCRTEEGDRTTDTDLPVGLGGTDSAPTPGVLLRAALGSCLAMGYRLRAARRGVALRSVNVTVETDSAIEGMLRMDSGVRPGFSAIRYHVEIDTDARREEIEAIVDEADRLSPILDAVAGTNTLLRSLTTVASAG